MAHSTPQFLDNGLPSHAAGYLLQHVSNHDPGASKSGLPVTDLPVSDHVAPSQLRLRFHRHTSLSRLYDTDLGRFFRRRRGLSPELIP